MKRIILWIDCEDKQCDSVKEKIGGLLKSLKLIHRFVEVSDLVNVSKNDK